MENKSALAPAEMHVSASGGRRGLPLSGSIAVLALSALLAAPAAGQTPLVDVPASADGPVHFSRAGVTRQTGAQNNVTLIHFLSTTNPSAGDVLPVMGRGFGLVAVAVTIPNYPQPNRWFVRGAPSISASNRDDLAVVIVGPAGTTPRVARLSATEQTSATGAPPSVNYIGPSVTWASQLHTDLNTYPTPSDWTVLVVDHTNPDVDMGALTYTPPPPPTPPLPQLTIDAPQVVEGPSGTTATLRFTARLSRTTRRTVTVAYEDARQGTARAGALCERGADYLAFAPGTLTFAPGTRTQTIDVTVIGDAVDEPDETVAVRLHSAVNATVPPFTEVGVGTIVDDDPSARSWSLPLVVADSNPVETGFVRIVNRSDCAGVVAIHAIDDAGRRAGPVSLSLDANAAAQLNSRDLEEGSASKGLSGGVGSGGAGPWRLELGTELDVEALAYVRTADGFVTSVHESVAEGEAGSMRYRVPFFNPGSNRVQQSRLRLVNPGDGAAAVVITGRDDAGEPSGSEVRLTLAAGESRSLGAAALEAGGDGLDGGLGDGSGKWRLTVSADRPLRVMSLLRSPTGNLTNVSGAGPEPEGGSPEPEGESPEPEGDPPAARTWTLPLVVADADPVRTGLVRVVNRSDRAGAIAIHAIDDAGRRAGPVSLSLGANAAVTFNSHDLEEGNASKGLDGGVGSGGAGPWRLELRTALDVEALAYIRTAEGFVTSVHGSAAEEDVEEEAGSMRHSYRVPFFNPGSNRRQQSRLRLVNLGDGAAEVVITGRDDAGESPGSEVRLTLAAGKARSLGAAALEEGGDGLDGSLGDGSGKWRLTVSADRPLRVMSLLRNPTGSLTNVSGAGPEPEVEPRP